MSHFYSDMLTWTVVGLFGGAVLLGTAGFDTAPRDVADASTQDIADPLPEPVDIRELDMAEASDALLLPQTVPIRDATLEVVTFTATGDRTVPDDSASAAAANTGVVTGESVNMRAGPGTSFAVVAQAARDDALQVTGETDGIWVEVILPDGGDDLAWIHGNYFNEPNPANRD